MLYEQREYSKKKQTLQWIRQSYVAAIFATLSFKPLWLPALFGSKNTDWH